MKRKKTIYSVVSFLLILIIAIVLSSCETSRTAPDVGRPNPPAPPGVALVLSGVVVDNVSGGAVAGATVTIQGTSLSTTTNGSGVFTFSDLSNISATSVVLHVSAANYGYASGIASIDKKTNQASYATIYLAKIITGTPATVTPASGGTASTSSTETSGSTTVQIVVPPSVISQTTQVSIAFVPSIATPPSPNPTITNDVSSVHVFPDNAVFASPGAAITFTLPFQITAGQTLPVYTIVNGAYQLANINATVDASGLTATAHVFTGGSFTLMANIGIAKSTSSVKGTTKTLYKTNDVPSATLASGQTTITLTTTTTNNTITQGNNNINPTWLKSEIGKFLNISNPADLNLSGTTIINTPVQLSFPGFGDHSNYITNGVEQNPNNPNEAGTWYYEWWYMPNTTNVSLTITENAYNPNFTVSFTSSVNSYVNDPSLTGWYWVAHTQGTTTYYGL